MLAYKLKAMHFEDDTLNLSPIRQNINAYPQEDNSCGDDSSLVIPGDWNFCDNVIAENPDLISNNINESRDSFISFIHIGGAKNRIYPTKNKLPQILPYAK